MQGVCEVAAAGFEFGGVPSLGGGGGVAIWKGTLCHTHASLLLLAPVSHRVKYSTDR